MEWLGLLFLTMNLVNSSWQCLLLLMDMRCPLDVLESSSCLKDA
jgi:hypothetical protein